MSTHSFSVSKYLIVKVDGGEVRLDHTNCFWCSSLENAVCSSCAAKADKLRKKMKNDLERAIAVIADLCGAGRPAVKESAEELAEWAEEFTDRYFQNSQPIIPQDVQPGPKP
jgi:hypothetical protein